MSKPKKSVYLGLETKIAADERGGIKHRWDYGRALLHEKAARPLRRGNGERKILPKDMITELIVDATRAGLKLSEREIQYRIKCASVYGSDVELRKAVAEFGTWSGLIQAGFPAVELDEPDTEVTEMEEVGLPTAAIQDALFDIPGFKPVLNIDGKKRDLADITIREAVNYRDMCIHMHENFGRTVAQVSATVDAMLTGAAGDLDANALDAYRRATEGESA